MERHPLTSTSCVTTTTTETTTMATEDLERRLGGHRRELLAFAYRMTGSVHDAEDVVQESMLRAWRARDRYDAERASVPTWLYRITTNVCLTALAQRGRRALPSDLGRPSTDPTAPLVPATDVPWLQPLPDALLDDEDPAEIVAGRTHLRLALVAAWQSLPARQRAVVILREALDCSATETAAILGTTATAVHSAHQRARATLATKAVRADDLDPEDDRCRTLVDAYVRAFERADVDAIARLVVDDVVLEMPPVPFWLRGRDDYRRFMAGVFARRGGGWRMVPTRANGQPALVAYSPGAGTLAVHSYQVFSVRPEGIARVTTFHDHALLSRIGVPPHPHTT
jgi:RNA polymerase sigma-70 factor (ECF subfamily)